MGIESVSNESNEVFFGQQEDQLPHSNLHEKIPEPPQISTEGRGYFFLQQVKDTASWAYSQAPTQESITSRIADSSTLNNALVMTEETLGQLLVGMLDYVIAGSSYESKDYVPTTIGNWIPSTKIESIFALRDQYLTEFLGSIDLAVEAAIERSHTNMTRKVASAVSSFIPIVGVPTNYSITLWHQLREVALIAALYGHDVHDPQVKMQILGVLVQGNVMKAPAQSVDVIVKKILETILLEAGSNIVPGIPIPTHLIFNYFSGNAAKVSTYAKATFKPQTAAG
jgi:hypothetical protein